MKILITVFILVASCAFSQQKWNIAISPGADFVISQTEDYYKTKELNKDSYFGFAANVSYSVQKNISVGLNSGYTKYDNYSLIPLQALGRYTFAGKNISPFIEMKIGTAFLDKSDYKGNINFGLGTGIITKFNENTGLKIGAEYKYLNPDAVSLSGGFLVGNEGNDSHEKVNASMINLNIGLIFSL